MIFGNSMTWWYMMSDTDTHAKRESFVTRCRCKDAEFSPMINFTMQVNALTGEILKSDELIVFVGLHRTVPS